MYFSNCFTFQRDKSYINIIFDNSTKIETKTHGDAQYIAIH